ncbi:MAG: LbtU family siderophore porin [Proteobacteria bacterium]|nr:LbtU family siderophore porin [Pseudomonadota bacterium]MBU1389940.1 LbtU family siderophore porin [Pseudomonadota bacterium]MBU1542539.1 LbtU family siderophore porin [Pseudomonadota bacterium]MBU2479708.1 LbtU family siderophore porin [Pseudomonadota bacterium]
MKNRLFIIFFTLAFFSAVGLSTAADGASNAELEDRIKKLEQDVKDATATPIGKISQSISLSGSIEVDYTYADDSDISNRTKNDATSDLDTGTVQLGIDARLHKYVTAVAVLKGEALDSNTNVFWDEAYFTISGQEISTYLIAGKRTQPFGVFNSVFINDPITQELYEINDTGVTIGYATDTLMGIDLSFTVYKGETLITHVNDAGLGWARNNTPGYAVTNDMNSYIISGSISPVEALTLSGFFNSEPGDSDRNTSFGMAVHFEMAGFLADAEYISALDRERHIADNLEYKENAWAITLGYQISDPLLIAVRYEAFDADKKADGNLDKRYGITGTYTLFKNDSFACNLMAEFRKSEYETVSPSSVDDELNEFFTRLAVEF